MSSPTSSLLSLYAMIHCTALSALSSLVAMVTKHAGTIPVFDQFIVACTDMSCGVFHAWLETKLETSQLLFEQEQNVKKKHFRSHLFTGFFKLAVFTP